MLANILYELAGHNDRLYKVTILDRAKRGMFCRSVQVCLVYGKHRDCSKLFFKEFKNVAGHGEANGRIAVRG